MTQTKLQWIDYSVGEREAHYRVYVGPTLAEEVTRKLRAQGVRANAGTADVYLVLYNAVNGREDARAWVNSVCGGILPRDVVVLK